MSGYTPPLCGGRIPPKPLYSPDQPRGSGALVTFYSFLLLRLQVEQVGIPLRDQDKRFSTSTSHTPWKYFSSKNCNPQCQGIDLLGGLMAGTFTHWMVAEEALDGFCGLPEKYPLSPTILKHHHPCSPQRGQPRLPLSHGVSWTLAQETLLIFCHLFPIRVIESDTFFRLSYAFTLR